MYIRAKFPTGFVQKTIKRKPERAFSEQNFQKFRTLYQKNAIQISPGQLVYI